MAKLDTQAQIAGLRQLKAKQEEVRSLNRKIDSLKSQIDQLRKKRTGTANLNLLPTNNAELLEAKLIHHNTKGKQTRRILFKTALILVILGLLAAMFLVLLENNQFLAENQPELKETIEKHSKDPNDIQGSPIYNLMLLGGLFAVVAVIWTFVPGEYILITGIVGIGVTGFGVLMMICCCVVLSLLGATYAAIPAVATLFIVINAFVTWSVDDSGLSRKQEQQLEKARELDQENHLKNQTARGKQADAMEQEQRYAIMDLNDQINDCEDEIDRLQAEIAENDLLVGNQIYRLDEVLRKLETQRAYTIAQALYGDGTPLETYTAEEDAREEMAMKARLRSYRSMGARQTDADIAAAAQKQASDHAEKIREIRKEQNEIIKQINEDAKYYRNR